jgi:hypothetical protein
MRPIIAEEFFDFLNSFAACFGIAVPKVETVSRGREGRKELHPEETYVKYTWMAAPIHITPNMINSFQVMFLKPGGTKRPRAKLNTQFPTAARP